MISGTLYGRLVDSAGDAWRSYTRHEFVLRLARGDLPEAAFRRYLVQDYLFLLHFARAWGLAVYKSDTLSEMRRAQSLLAAILDVEIGLHIDYCRDWGLSEARARMRRRARRAVRATGRRGAAASARRNFHGGGPARSRFLADGPRGRAMTPHPDIDLPGDPAGHRVVVAMSGGVDSSVT